MSSAIKPPGAPGTGGPTGAGSAEAGSSEVGGPAGTSSVERSEAFRHELSKAEVSKAEGAGTVEGTAAPASAQRTELLRAIADEIRSGRVDPKQAVDRLIERALTTGPAASLPPARRAELEALMRAALEEDPTMLAMQRDLTRGR